MINLKVKREIEKEYHNSVNEKIVNYVIDVLTEKINSEFKLVDISPKEIEDIKKITGVDITGFTRVLTADSIRHIEKRHGKNGLADKSMSDVKDIARMEYALKNYDEIKEVKPNWQYQNSDGTRAKTILYTMRITGNYFIAEVVPNNKKKQLIIKSAYKSKTK